jgi:phage/plasmid-like protein (TIGR03299 family)
VTTREGVAFRPFLSAATSLDGSIATSFFTGSTVIICDNTLHLAIRRAVERGDIYKVKHTRNSEVNVGLARQALSIVFQTADAFTEEIDRLTSAFISDDQWTAFLDEVAPNPKADASPRERGMKERKRTELDRLWKFDERVAPWKNSKYGAIAAVNTYANHIQTVKGVERGERNVAKLIDGSFAKLDANALRILETVV